MMSVSEIGRTPVTSASAAAPGNLGRDEFLQLLVAQLENQSPLDPMENEAFVAQLAQFRALEEMENVRRGIELETAYMSSLNNSASTALIGRDVVAGVDSFVWEGGGELAIGAEGSPSSRVSLRVLDESGRVVHQRELLLDEGTMKLVAWTGEDATGRALPPGRYRIEVTGVDAQGGSLPVNPLLAGRVTALAFVDGAARLRIEGTEVNLGTVREVHG